MPGFPVPLIKFREDDRNGFPLAGGKLYSYTAGLVNTPLATYTSQALTVANLNPVILDAEGRANVFIPDGIAYKFILHDALGNELWSVDEVMVPPVVATPAPPVMPPGTIVAFGSSVVPAGWLLCDGSSVSKSLYGALHDVIGDVYGGSGGSTFNVPDLRQRFPLGKAVSGIGVSLGQTGGAIDHTHTIPHSNWLARQTTLASAVVGFTLTTSGGTANVDTPTTDIASGTANPPYLVVNFLIKT